MLPYMPGSMDSGPVFARDTPGPVPRNAFDDSMEWFRTGPGTRVGMPPSYTFDGGKRPATCSMPVPRIMLFCARGSIQLGLRTGGALP